MLEAKPHCGAASTSPCADARAYFLYFAFCASDSLPHAAPSALPTSPKLISLFFATILGRSSLQKIMYGPGGLLTLSALAAGLALFLAMAFFAGLAAGFAMTPAVKGARSERR